MCAPPTLVRCVTRRLCMQSAKNIAPRRHLDFAQDMNDRKMNRRIACSTLALWGKGGPLDHWYAEAGGPLGIWRDWTNDVTGHPIEGGHFFPEHNPQNGQSNCARSSARSDSSPLLRHEAPLFQRVGHECSDMRLISKEP